MVVRISKNFRVIGFFAESKSIQEQSKKDGKVQESIQSGTTPVSKIKCFTV